MCGFCHSRPLLFLEKIFWTHSGPNQVLDMPIKLGLDLDIRMFQEYQENAVLFLLQTHCALQFAKRPGTTTLLSKT